MLKRLNTIFLIILTCIFQCTVESRKERANSYKWCWFAHLWSNRRWRRNTFFKNS